ncbi:tRNA pseudouridine(38-40) synthase TruA [Sandaracinobacteroides saxicola]|uniref:tRNA pseudouridine synthase A n=1 Tax=Sandaracinobacteroides saxicola TaxID=2759707 RepID=A0A7G5IKQ1_9SPHN|nr:tRNA pseudouridine(38-40) synthase TruA [Sandaracinobacteroides saxicola]QMW23943.1 tRNA pseudouridine(38-40) synthase TruA [Sandaracinobacteroides saxicola]
MTRFRLTLEYDGRGLMGWQRQAHGPSVQQHLEDAVLAAFGETTTVHAAGRTDAGVHATAMPAHLDLAKDLTPFRLSEALNYHLRAAGAAVAVLDARLAPPDWHARFSCTGRAYEYRILLRRAPLTHEAGLVWRLPPPLDPTAMAKAAAHLIGHHDFTTFRSVACQAASPLKTLDRLDVVADDDRLTIHAAARSFLHHQVRSMVGCLVLVGRGQWSPAQLAAALAARNRAALGLNAPPDGLWFVGANYDGA